MVGKKIKARRLELGLTQEELAHKIGYKSKSTVNKIELDIHDVNQTQILKFAKALEVPPSYFVDDIEIELNGDVKKCSEMLSGLSEKSLAIAMQYIEYLYNTEKKGE